jgi:steroid delta-isomerase-like uncharacterized protein
MADFRAYVASVGSPINEGDMLMSDAATIAREYFETFNKRDWDGMRSLFHPDYTYMGGDGVVQKGADAAMAINQGFANGMSDARIKIERTQSTGNIAVTEFTGTGTHDGDLMGIAPTGKKLSMPVCNVIEVKDGKILAEREYMDMMHLMQQIGAVPAPATA